MTRTLSARTPVCEFHYATIWDVL